MDDLERIERGRDVTAGLDYERSQRDWDDELEPGDNELDADGHRAFAREYRRHGDYDAAEMHEREAHG